jgi:hypothetical protein
LTIRFSGTGYWNEGFNNIKIPFGVASNIQINAVGLKVEVMVNEVVTHFMNLPAQRTTGPAILHISDPCSKPVNASISNVRLAPITPAAEISKSNTFNTGYERD